MELRYWNAQSWRDPRQRCARIFRAARGAAANRARRWLSVATVNPGPSAAGFLLVLLQIGTGKCANGNSESDNYPANYPAVIEPERIDARPLRIDTRIGDRNRVAPREPCHGLLSRVHNPMRRTVGVFELEYRIDLPGVPALEVDDCSSCLQGIGRRSLVAAVKQSAGENETRGESQKTNQSRHGSRRISGACKEDSDECPFWAEPRRLNALARPARVSASRWNERGSSRRPVTPGG